MNRSVGRSVFILHPFECRTMIQPQQEAKGICGPLFIISGPTGTGKTTLIARLLETESSLHLSVSATTRPARTGEVDGVNYHFWTRERFQAGIAAGEFLEWAEGFGNYYGTLAGEVEPYRKRGIGVILEIDSQGWEQVKRLCPDAYSIFVRASSLSVYEQRLRARGSETEAGMQRRLQSVARELGRAAEYDCQVINDDLQTALNDLRAAIKRGEALFLERKATHAG